MITDLFNLVEVISGIAFILWGVATVINKNIIPTHLEVLMKNDSVSQALNQLMAALFMMAGIFIIAVHNEWSWSSSVLVTLLGWVITIKCFLWLAIPKHVLKLVHFFKPYIEKEIFRIALSVCWILVGLFIFWDHIYIFGILI